MIKTQTFDQEINAIRLHGNPAYKAWVQGHELSMRHMKAGLPGVVDPVCIDELPNAEEAVNINEVFDAVQIRGDRRLSSRKPGAE